MDKIGLVVSDGSDRGKIDVDATDLEIDGAGFKDVDLTVDFANGVALNGLASGQSEKNSTWYSVWGVARPCGTDAGLLLQEGFTEPTCPGDCTAYTRKRMLAPVYNDAGGDLLRFHNINDEWHWAEASSGAFFRKFGAAAPVDWAAGAELSLAGPMPSVSRQAIVSLIVAATAAGAFQVHQRPAGDAATDNVLVLSTAYGASDWANQADLRLVTDAAQLVDHYGVNCTTYWDVRGFIWKS